METIRKSFNIFVPAKIVGDEDKSKPVRIGGIISSSIGDLEGDRLTGETVDYTPLKEGWGKIKFEHDSVNLKEPDNIIGFPLDVEERNGELWLLGELIPFEGIPDEQLSPQQRTAKSTYYLMKAIEEHNKRHPNKPQRLGFSVEGTVIRDKRTREIKKAILTSVVVTTKPVNRRTFASLLKSLSVGYGLSPAEQTGFGATRQESIDSYNKNQTKGERNMVFKNFEEALEYYLSQGLSEEDAKAKAKEYFEKQGKGDEPDTGDNEPDMGEPEPIQKSLKVAKAKFNEAIKSAKASLDVTLDIDFEELEESLRKSLKTDGDEIDLSDYFEAKQKSDVAMLEVVAALGEKQESLAKSIKAMAEGFNKFLEVNGYIHESVDFVKESQKLANQALLKSLKAKATTGIVPSDLLKGVEAYGQNRSEIQFEKLEKSVVADALFELYQKGKIPATAVSGYEGTGYVDERHKQQVIEYLSSKQ